MLYGAFQARLFSRRSVSAVWFALVLFSTSMSNAERLPIKTYTVADGLLRDNVSKIKQDSRGFLWFCTSEGISRFDGTAMTSFTVADGLPSRFVEDFLETKNGTIYIATGKGLARLNPHGLRASPDNPLFTIFTPDNPQAADIITLFEDKNNLVWVGTADGLYKLIETAGDGVRFETVPLGEPLGGFEVNGHTLYVKTILEDRRGTLWVGTEGNGLFRFSPLTGERRRLTIADGLGDNKISDLLEMRDGRLWVSFRGGAFSGLCLLDAEINGNPVKKCYTAKDGLPTTWIPDLLETSDGKFWLATVAGLCLWQGESSGSVCKTYAAKNDLCDGVDGLAEDKDGNLWTGSSCGAKKIARYGFTTYLETDGLNSAYINSIFENRAGELFASTNDGRRAVSRFNGEKFSPARLPQLAQVKYFGWGWRQTVRQDAAGAWWIPTGQGIFRSPDKTAFENLDRAPLERVETGAGEVEVFRTFEDSRGDVWITTVGMKHGLRRWERARNVWHDYTPQVGFSLYRIGSAFAEDRYGNIWIGASSDNNQTALIRYRNGEFRILTQTDGAPSGWIRDLFADSRGRLWIASTNDGLWRLDDPNAEQFEFVKYAPSNGLTSISTTSVTEDAFGRIYVGTWRGVDRITPDTGQIENFSVADGLPASFVETAFRDQERNLWFGTYKGLTRFVPEPPRSRVPPTVLITGLRVEGEQRSVSMLGETTIAPLDLNAQQRQITVDFLGLGASLGEKLRYEYRFADSDWTPTDERTVNFANLAAGNYRFEVRAQTADRIYSPPATVSFKIAAPVWQRWWFVASVLLLTALAIFLFYKNRLARLLEMERMRTRIATDLHDDIGANLTRISLLSEVAKQKSTNGSGNLLTSIADIARESVASMNDIVWAISPDHDSLLDLTRRMRQHAEEVFSFRDVDLDFNAPASDLKLSVGVRRDVLLIFKEAVSNAAKHSECSRVAIDFRCENSILHLRIEDDGKGFIEDLENDGQGLRSMTRRAKTLGGDLNIDSRQKSGTTIELALPLLKMSQI